MIIELLGRALQRTTQFDFVCTLVLGCITLRAYRKKVQRLPLPPGQSSLPLIGNVYDLPEGYGGHDFTKYLDKYGTKHDFYIKCFVDPSDLNALRTHLFVHSMGPDIHYNQR